MVFRGHEITTGTANKGDALITLEITKSDGVKIEITSKSVKEILAAANLGNARVLIEDHGALDFVIRARLETAIQRFVSEKEY